MTNSEIMQILLGVFSMGSVYGLIRADLNSQRDKLKDLSAALEQRIGAANKDIGRIESSATKAHERLDMHVTTYHRDN